MKKLFKSKNFWENVSIALIAMLLFIGLRLTIQSSFVDGPSVENTFQNGERLLVNKLAYKFSSPQRGDVIIFHPPIPSASPFIKRVIGLPGERVEIENGAVTVVKPDGSTIILDEPYIKNHPITTIQVRLSLPMNILYWEIIVMIARTLIMAGLYLVMK